MQPDNSIACEISSYTEVRATASPYSRQFMPLLPEPQSFSAFLIIAKTWDHIGLFGTGFHPSYCEDLE